MLFFPPFLVLSLKWTCTAWGDKPHYETPYYNDSYLWFLNLMAASIVSYGNYMCKWVNLDIHLYCYWNCQFGREESMLSFGFHHHLLFCGGKHVRKKEMGVKEPFIKDIFLSKVVCRIWHFWNRKFLVLDILSLQSGQHFILHISASILFYIRLRTWDWLM